MTDNDTNFGQVRHWFAANVSVSDDGEVVVYSAPQYNVSPYVGPAPLPNYMYHRPHRYIFILARSTSGSQVSVSAEDFQKLQEPYVAAFKGAQNDGVQDLKDRWGFNAQKFIEMRGLEVEAATFMLVSGTMKSAAANMLMSGQAMVNKVSRYCIYLKNLLTQFRPWGGENLAILCKRNRSSALNAGIPEHQIDHSPPAMPY